MFLVQVTKRNPESKEQPKVIVVSFENLIPFVEEYSKEHILVFNNVEVYECDK